MQVDLINDSQLKCLYGLGISGLLNIGNTCFMNTALRCLMSVKVFVSYFLSNQYTEDINNDKVEHEFIENFANLTKKIWEENAIIRPINFKNGISKFYLPYASAHQHDAAEAFIKIIELLHEGLSYKAEIRPIETGAPLSDQDKINLLAIDAWKRAFENNYSIPLKLFHGQNICKVKCNSCKNVSIRFDTFCTINLPITDSTNTLYDCINQYVLSQDMDDKLTCEHCKTKCNVSIRNSIWKMPPVLTFCFNRFGSSQSVTHKLIDFPVTKANFSNLAEKNSDKRVIYDLVSIANYRGNMDFGHYWAFSKCSDGSWKEFDDEKITDITDLSNLATEHSYFLVYVKRGITNEIVIS